MKQNKPPISRRDVLKASLGMGAMSLCPGNVSRAFGFESASARPRIGVIGCGVRWDKRVFVPDGRYGVGKEFPKFGDIVSVCDVDANRLERAKGIVKGWLGKVPDATGEFRWWYDYSGGKLTDWGAHHVDIATWGMDKTDTGPLWIDPVMVEHPVEFKDGYPTVDNRYNTATKFEIKAVYDDGMELTMRHDTDNGILFEGTKGRIFVNRGKLVGKPVEDLASNPLPDGALEKVYKNRDLTNHVANFFEAVAARKEPISDVFSHHRALTTCHLAGIAARIGRKIQWDPKSEKVVGDQLAQSLVAREKRQGFAIEK